MTSNTLLSQVSRNSDMQTECELRVIPTITVSSSAIDLSVSPSKQKIPIWEEEFKPQAVDGGCSSCSVITILMSGTD